MHTISLKLHTNETKERTYEKYMEAKLTYLFVCQYKQFLLQFDTEIGHRNKNKGIKSNLSAHR